MSRNLSVTDPRPNNQSVIDQKPQNDRFTNPIETEQLHTVILGASQPMGLLLTLLYRDAGTVQNAITA